MRSLLRRLSLITLFATVAWGQVPDARVKAISDRIRTLRSLDDGTRARVTKELVAAINAVSTKDRLALASQLANLSTEGDFGHDTLQSVTKMLESAIKAYPPAPAKDGPAATYFQLARLERYEHMKISVKDPQYAQALQVLKADDDARDTADFTLTDLDGKQWNRKSLAGKVVLVNFWATWCPPCRKEMPDLDAIYKRFASKGLVILAISDEDQKIVRPFIANEQKVSYPILLDPGRKVTEQFRVDGIPKTFLYDRKGRLAAQSIDMRTMSQFLALLKLAGLE